MPRINLLPWREADRQQRQKEFLTAMAAAFLVGVLSVMSTIWVYSMKNAAEKYKLRRQT